MIGELFEAGADAFRVNMSHGDQASKVAGDRGDPQPREEIWPADDDPRRPSGAQAARRQVRRAARSMLETGQQFTLDRDTTPGDATRVELPHREIFEAAHEDRRAAAARRRQAGAARDSSMSPDRIVTSVEVGGPLSNNKGLNVPDVVRADGGADREGPQRPGVRGRAGRRLDRARRSSSAPRIWPRRAS